MKYFILQIIVLSIQVFRLMCESNYVIDTPVNQVDDPPANWAYPINVCLPNQMASSGVTGFYKYFCKTNKQEAYVERKTYAVDDQNCDGEVMNKTIFTKGDAAPGYPGYFVCNEDKSEYGVIKVYDNDPTCSSVPIPLYSSIGDLCFSDKMYFTSLNRCTNDPTEHENNVITHTLYGDNQCKIPIFASDLTPESCGMMGVMNLKDGSKLLYGSFDRCFCNKGAISCQ